MIRRVHAWELYDVIPLAEQFHRESALGGVFDASTLLHTLTANKSIVVGKYDGGKLVGVLVAIITKQMMTTSIIAQEVMWYLLPEYRSKSAIYETAKMVQVYEDWAKKSGADVVGLAALNTSPDSVKKFYNRSGYQEIESHFIKFI